MNLHVFQHVDFEGPGRIAAWAFDRGHRLTTTRFHHGDLLPDLAAIDGLIVLGGPMNAYQNEQFPWLLPEKQYIARFLQTNRPTLGICLGAQLLADVLGGTVFPHVHREFGWAAVDFTAAAHAVFPFLPRSLPVLHWHGDTYTLPPGARKFAHNEWCAEQGFLWKQHVLALQFHLEAGPAECQQLLRFCGADLARPGSRVQTAQAILGGAHQHAGATGALLRTLLDHWFQPAGNHFPAGIDLSAR